MGREKKGSIGSWVARQSRLQHTQNAHNVSRDCAYAMFAIHIYAYRIKQISQMRVNATSRPSNNQQALASTSSLRLWLPERRRECDFHVSAGGNWISRQMTRGYFSTGSFWAKHISAVSSYRQTDRQKGSETDWQTDRETVPPVCHSVWLCALCLSLTFNA